MAMNRRNVLIGLGAIAAGGGAAFGSGAFSSVEADRSVTVETAGDASAFLKITGNHDGEYINDNSSTGALELDLGAPTTEALNEDATTVITGIFTVENQAADGGSIDVGFGSAGSKSGTTTISIGNTDVTFSLPSDSVQTLTSGGTADVDVSIDTTDASNDGTTTGTITVVGE